MIRRSFLDHHFLDRSRMTPYAPVRPKQRIPEVKRMTIAAGFRCNGGIIFGADTYESVGDMRDRVHKIPSIHEDYCAAMITGSCTDGHLMDALIERIWDVVGASRPENYRDLENLLRSTVLTFYREDIQALPDPKPVVIDLLIAAKLPQQDRPEAWSARSSVIRRMQDSEVLGIGAYVRYVLRHLYTNGINLSDGALAMTLLLSIAKERVAFVGGDCYIKVLKNKSTASQNCTLSSMETEGLYDYFLSHGRQLILATGNARLTEDQYGAVLRHFLQNMKAYRDRLIATSSADFRARLMDEDSTSESG